MCRGTSSWWDHPRMRGEHAVSRLMRSARIGSSPHVRGARTLVDLDFFKAGIIPACAGSTRRTASIQCAVWDHPRMHGEHPLQLFGSKLCLGSSPHARGALRAFGYLWGGSGIIPACAGSTLPQCAHSRARRDHPRMRGEHSAPRLPLSVTLGSSPHARGALPLAEPLLPHCGIIPACAGSTSDRRKWWPQCRDHPRMRGEHEALFPSRSRPQGSSPHARGAR